MGRKKGDNKNKKSKILISTDETGTTSSKKEDGTVLMLYEDRQKMLANARNERKQKRDKEIKNARPKGHYDRSEGPVFLVF